jgi:hypothetical protein
MTSVECALVAWYLLRLALRVTLGHCNYRGHGTAASKTCRTVKASMLSFLPPATPCEWELEGDNMASSVTPYEYTNDDLWWAHLLFLWAEVVPDRQKTGFLNRSMRIGWRCRSATGRNNSRRGLERRGLSVWRRDESCGNRLCCPCLGCTRGCTGCANLPRSRRRLRQPSAFWRL